MTKDYLGKDNDNQKASLFKPWGWEDNLYFLEHVHAWVQGLSTLARDTAADPAGALTPQDGTDDLLLEHNSHLWWHNCTQSQGGHV